MVLRRELKDHVAAASTATDGHQEFAFLEMPQEVKRYEYAVLAVKQPPPPPPSEVLSPPPLKRPKP